MFRFQASRWRWTFTKNGEEDTEHAQGNQNRFCGPVMRSNCCCNSHSTTKRVSCKKGSISSAAQTRACSPPLLLLLWDVAGWGDRVIVLESMQIRRPHENGRAVFSDFSTLRPVFKKVRFQDPYGRSAKTMQYLCVFAKERCRLDGALKVNQVSKV